MRIRVTLALVLVQVFFGIHYFATKLLLEFIAPRAWAALRITGAAILLLVWHLLVRRGRLPTGAQWRSLAVFAVFGVIINQILFIEGLSRTTPSHSSIINSLIPVLTLSFALLLRREVWTPRRLVSILLSLTGVLVLLHVEKLRFDEAWVIGDLLTLANATSFSFFLVISKRYFERHGALGSTAWIMALGAVGTALIASGPLQQLDLRQFDWRFWGLATYAIVFATTLAYLLNSYALRHVESSLVALFIYLQAPIATFLSVTFLDEPLTGRFLVAAAAIFAGVFFAVSGQRPLHAASRSPRGSWGSRP
jgi:drug/metabolite transporter (DMT)-like permease